MPNFAKTNEGRWRPRVLAWITLFLISALYDFVREGWGSLTGIQYLLLAVGAVALAPAKDESERRLTWSVLRSPRYLAGAMACAAAAGILLYRVARDTLHR